MKMLELRKYGDKLLFTIALAVLLGALLSIGIGYITRQKASSTMVFTQWWNDELEMGDLINLVDKFESQHSGIRVILDTRSYEDIYCGFLLGDGFSGDIFSLDILWVPELLSKEIIENPSPAILSFINILYYNIDILTEAGFSRPPRNRSEFTAYSRAVTNSGHRGLVMDTNGARGAYDDVLPWIWSAGISLTSSGNPTVTNTPVTASFAFLEALNSEGLILHSNGRKFEDFIFGRAAFMIAPARIIDFVREHMGDEAFSVTSIPPPDNYAGRTLFAASEWVLAINPASAQKAEAELFLDFLVENAPLFLEKDGADSSNTVQAFLDPFYSKVWEIALAGENARDFDGLPWVEMDIIFREELDALFSAKSSPDQTTTAIQKRWGDVLRE